MQNGVNAIANLTNYLSIHIGGLQPGIKLFIFFLEHSYFMVELFAITGSNAVGFQITNRLVVLGKLALMRFSVFLTS